MLGAENVFEMQPHMGSEDFSFFAEAIPAYYFIVGMKDDAQGPFESGHSPYFRVNEDVLPYGAALHASSATSYIIQHKSESASAGKSLHDEL